MVSEPDTIRQATTQSLPAARRGRIFRRCGIAAMLVFVAAGMFGVLGHRQGAKEAVTSEYRIAVSYPNITRGGLAANWEIRVERLDGEPLPASFELHSDAGYFSIFDENGFTPEPSSTWSDGSTVVWTFEPDGPEPVLVVSFDARLQPNTRGWFDGSTELVVDDTTEVAVDYRTWGVP
jgi:hypothetical protein